MGLPQFARTAGGLGDERSQFGPVGHGERDIPAPAAAGAELVPFNESRWPPAAAVLLFMILNIAMRIWLPREPIIAAPWRPVWRNLLHRRHQCESTRDIEVFPGAEPSDSQGDF